MALHEGLEDVAVEDADDDPDRDHDKVKHTRRNLDHEPKLEALPRIVQLCGECGKAGSRHLFARAHPDSLLCTGSRT